MRTTLFHIPAEFGGLPVFGVGWLLAIWIAFAIGLSLWLLRRPGGTKEVAAYLPYFAIVALLIVLGLPNLVEADASGKPIGLPIRGYGVMLMLATVAGVGLAAYRAWQVGIDPEVVYSLAFVMFIAGIIGARLFYVAQYWHDEFSPARTGSAIATLWALLNVPKGGLVVYGSVLFGVPAGIWYCRKRGLPVLAMGDIIAPSMVVGLALGRVGCFLNGCCFGGICLTHDYAVAFPADSPPYAQHEQLGWNSGIWLESRDGKIVIGYLAPHGPAKNAGLEPGDEIVSINGTKVTSLAEARQKLAAGHASFEVETADQRIVRWTSNARPPRSVPVHAAQLYAAIDAALLALVLWFFFPYRSRDGEVFALLVTVHPISRFLLEMIRSDEPGQFRTSLTISQWLSLVIVAMGIALWVYIERLPRGTALPQAAT